MVRLISILLELNNEVEPIWMEKIISRTIKSVT